VLTPIPTQIIQQVASCATAAPYCTQSDILKLIATIIGAAFVLVVTIVGVVIWLNTQFHGLREKFTPINTDLVSVKSWLGSLLVALEGKVDGKSMKHLAHQLGTFKAQASGNPISSEEAENINKYLGMVMEEKAFTPSEAQQFKVLVEKFVSDEEIIKKFDKNQLDTLVVVSGGIYGTYYLGLNKEEHQETK
jgi:hypothetical protein